VGPLFERFFIFSGPVGIWIKIYLNPKIQSRQSIRAFSYFLYIKHSLHQYSHSLTFVWSSTNTGSSSSLFLLQLLQIALFAVDISMTLSYRDSTEKPSQSMYNIVCSGLVGIGFPNVIGFYCHLEAPWCMKNCVVGLNAITTKQIF
jgi:hypothetical protein